MSLEFCIFPVFVVGSGQDNHGTFLLRAGAGADPMEFVRKNVCLGRSRLGWMGNIVTSKAKASKVL